jgi:hypothetical protein
MTLTTNEARRLVSSLDAKLLELEHALPTSPSNTGQVALRYWFYNWLARQVDGKLRKAVNEAIETGVIFDHKAKPLEGGTVKPVYDDDMVGVTVSVSRSTHSIKWDRVREDLVDGGYISKHTLGELIAKHTSANAAAHKFSSVLKESDKPISAEPSMS